MVIYDSMGTVECGLVGVGGNNDTVYVQINGTGCAKLFDFTTHKKVHWWLSLLGITRLARLDLCVDDYTEDLNACHLQGTLGSAHRSSISQAISS